MAQNTSPTNLPESGKVTEFRSRLRTLFNRQPRTSSNRQNTSMAVLKNFMNRVARKSRTSKAKIVTGHAITNDMTGSTVTVSPPDRSSPTPTNEEHNTPLIFPASTEMFSSTIPNAHEPHPQTSRATSSQTTTVSPPDANSSDNTPLIFPASTDLFSSTIPNAHEPHPQTSRATSSQTTTVSPPDANSSEDTVDLNSYLSNALNEAQAMAVAVEAAANDTVRMMHVAHLIADDARRIAAESRRMANLASLRHEECLIRLRDIMNTIQQLRNP